MALRSAVAFGALLLSAAANAQVFSADRVHADVAFLADDLLEGRATGSRGYDIAARYVAERFAAMGLKPAGANGGWLQPIDFIRTEYNKDKAPAVTINGQRFVNTDHVLLNPPAQFQELVDSAPAVFVGYGLEDKSLGLDDLSAFDLKGKIAVVLSGTPEGLPGDVAATLEDRKFDVIAEKGAIGIVTIFRPALLKIFPWEKILANSALARMRWIHPDGHVEEKSPNLKLNAGLDPVAARKLFEGSPLDGRVEAMLADPKARPRGFALQNPIRIERYSTISRATSANVLGMIPGSDPKLKNEVVMLSAHLDHLGFMGDGKDRIANGAMDNAAGVAAMLEAAHAFATSGKGPRRTVVFVALTGEEKGLFGSAYLARYPLPAGHRLVADVNLDEPIMTYDFTDVVAWGAEHSTIGQVVKRAAASMGVALSPDPFPEQNIFVRSDHYSFVEQGVPSLMLGTGFANGGKAAFEAYDAKHYHDPSDDLSQPFNWAAGAKFARLNYLIARDLADAPQAPRWYKGDYFGDKFAAGAPKAPKP